MTRKPIYLTKKEVEALKKFCDDNLTTGYVEVAQSKSQVGLITKVHVEDFPDTLTDITDYDSWAL